MFDPSLIQFLQQVDTQGAGPWGSPARDRAKKLKLIRRNANGNTVLTKKGKEVLRTSGSGLSGPADIPIDKVMARELEIYIDNDGDLNRQMVEPIRKNMQAKLVRGTYNHALAVKGWMNLVDQGARKYVREFGGNVRDSFPKSLRAVVAARYADEFITQTKDKELDSYVNASENDLAQRAREQAPGVNEVRDY